MKLDWQAMTPAHLAVIIDTVEAALTIHTDLEKAERDDAVDAVWDALVTVFTDAVMLPPVKIK